MKQLIILIFLLFSLYSISQTIEYNQIYISDSQLLTDTISSYLYIEYKLDDKIVCHIDIYKIDEFIIEDVYMNNNQIYSISYSIKNLNGLKYLKKYEFIFKLE
jgi:hypothetical protein